MLALHLQDVVVLAMPPYSTQAGIPLLVCVLKRVLIQVVLDLGNEHSKRQKIKTSLLR